MPSITFTTKDVAAATRLVSAIKFMYPIPEVWVDEKDHEQGKEPQYTDADWVKVIGARYFKSLIQRAEAKQARDAVSVDVPADTII